MHDDLLHCLARFLRVCNFVLRQSLQVSGVRPLLLALLVLRCLLCLRVLDLLGHGFRVDGQVGGVLVKGLKVVLEDLVLLQGLLVGNTLSSLACH